MTITDLKGYIIENDKIPTILEGIKCGHIKYHSNKEYYSCSNYNGDNETAIQVFVNKHISVKNYTRNIEEIDSYPDIITLIKYNLNIDFVSAIKWLHKILELKFELQYKKEEKPKFNPLAIFEKVKKRNKINIEELVVLEETSLYQSVPLLHIKWLREGIVPKVAQKFGIGFNYHTNRITIPFRYWLDGSLLGINARTMVDNYEDFGIKKYLITQSYKKNLNLYGLWENQKDIIKQGCVVVYESEKSVLKRCSLLDNTGVALSGHEISEEQVKILIGLNVEIIIALDKDVSQNEIRHICEKFYHIRSVSYIYDKWNLLKEKESPADKEDKIFNFLKKFKIQYDEKEHSKYIKSLDRK